LITLLANLVIDISRDIDRLCRERNNGHSAMTGLSVHLAPSLVQPEKLAGSITVIVDILRATTTMIHALVAGAARIIAVGEIEEAFQLSKTLPEGSYLLAGERGGRPIKGFDLGNSPSEFTRAKCNHRDIIMTTTNGTRAILHAQQARRILIGAFVNFSAICQELLTDGGDVHIVCAGTDQEVTLEDTVFAGAVVQKLVERGDFHLNDGARMAWDVYEGHGSVLKTSLELSLGGRNLIEIGMGSDIDLAARVDRFGIIGEVFDVPPTVRMTNLRWEERIWRTS
jgi:2-phosphosulfolactate phosphatase